MADEADFSGWATKAGLKCSDGRTIMPDAFAHQDTVKVPLVWQHGHNDPVNVLGHTILENRKDGVYAYAYFNDTPAAEHARGLVAHGDINSLSIWANELVERSGRVLHGIIREVSLVLSGANPGALIENVSIRHADGDEYTLGDEAIIHTGMSFELVHEASDDSDEETIADVYESMSEKQKQVLYFMLGEALKGESPKELKQSAYELEDQDQEGSDMSDELIHEDSDDETVAEVYESMSEKQKQVLHFMLGEALESGELKQSAVEYEEEEYHEEAAPLVHAATQVTKEEEMSHNIFESDTPAAAKLSHSAAQGIMADATKSGSLREAVETYALAHGIDNIDALFPDAKAIDGVPEFLQRRVEWVASFLGATRKSPFSRIKTLHADITVDEARAKGYVTGAMKKEEFFSVSKRVTVPTTIYKKQKLDRDDMIDITDFDVVTWLKGEMRLMLDEEIARAALIGDGRDVSHEDKINEGNIRPIATDHELYTTTVNINIKDDGSSAQEIIDAIIRNRKHLKGSGTPTMYTTETIIAEFLLLKDSLGRRIYADLGSLARELRVTAIVPVEVMEEEQDLVCVIVNPSDYIMGATRGGEITMFDDFDIDYNQHKYLIETRMCGALVKLKSAMCVRSVEAGDTLVAPAPASFDEAAMTVTITDTEGVVYRDGDGNTVTNGGGPYTVVVGEAFTVNAEAEAGYYFATNADDSWTFFVRS